MKIDYITNKDSIFSHLIIDDKVLTISAHNPNDCYRKKLYSFVNYLAKIGSEALANIDSDHSQIEANKLTLAFTVAVSSSHLKAFVDLVKAYDATPLFRHNIFPLSDMGGQCVEEELYLPLLHKADSEDFMKQITMEDNPCSQGDCSLQQTQQRKSHFRP